MKNKNSAISVIHTIVELMFSEGEKPFSSSEFFEWLGFTRHSNLKQFLNNPTYHTYTVWDDCGGRKIAKRSGEVVFMNRDLFLKLVQRRKPEFFNELQANYLKWKIGHFEKKLLQFNDFGKKKGFSNVGYVTGKHYAYSLKTHYFAADIGLCPFDVFRFCAENFCSKYHHVSANCTHDSIPIPYISFDSKKHTDRYLFLKFVQFFRKEYKLDDFTKSLIDAYIPFLEKMLDKQARIDIRAGRMGNPQKPKKKATTAESKALYRELALMCHPDRHPDLSKKELMNGIFVQLGAFYEASDFNGMVKLKEKILAVV